MKGSLKRIFCVRIGVEVATNVSSEISTAQSFIIVGQDATRTMLTYIDPKSFITKDDIDLSLLEKGKIIYLSGYILDSKEGIEVAKYVMDFSKKAHKKIAMTLANQHCVARHRELFLEIIDNYLDFVFANKLEINALLGTSAIEESIKILLEKCKNNNTVYTITAGSEPTILIHKGTIITVPVPNVPQIIDKTGIGSIFASGILYGYLKGYPLGKCVELGNRAAAQVIGNLGARPSSELSSLLDHNYQETNQGNYPW